MTVDVTKLQFYSGYPIDKITQQATISYTVAAGTPSAIPPYNGSLKNIVNTTSSKSLINASWSLDGVNFISTQATTNYINGSQVLPKAAVTVGSSDNLIYFYLINNFTSSLTFTINYAVYSVA